MWYLGNQAKRWEGERGVDCFVRKTSVLVLLNIEQSTEIVSANQDVWLNFSLLAKRSLSVSESALEHTCLTIT